MLAIRGVHGERKRKAEKIRRAELSLFKKCITRVSLGKHFVKQWIISMSQYYPHTEGSRIRVVKVNVYKTNCHLCAVINCKPRSE